ncbi:hypothetical protein ACQ4PT_059273 [Festuca glaucescens]
MDTAPTEPSPSFRLRNGCLNALRLRRVFDLFDRNGDGKITTDEMGSALDTLGLGADRAGLEATVAAYIPAGANGLSFNAFESLHRALGDVLWGPIVEQEEPEKEGEDEDMKEAFRRGNDEELPHYRRFSSFTPFRQFDQNGDGFISTTELQAMVKKLGVVEARSLATVQEMICNVDRDRDGQVDFGEFKIMMLGMTVWGA